MFLGEIEVRSDLESDGSDALDDYGEHPRGFHNHRGETYGGGGSCCIFWIVGCREKRKSM